MTNNGERLRLTEKNKEMKDMMLLDLGGLEFQDLLLEFKNLGPFFSKADLKNWSSCDRHCECDRIGSKQHLTATALREMHASLGFQTDLSQAIQERKERYITHEELAKLMKWKLSRGKFRPRLTEMVQTNSSDLVEKSSRQAFKKLPNVGAAIKELIVLKAVGPATASAVLAAGAPEHAPFMADESMLAIPGQSPLAYTEAAYKRYNAEVQDCVKRLKKEDPSGEWTPHKVELALWTHYMACKLDPSLLASKTGPSKKRKSTGDGEGETPKKK
eukprot:XP_011673775.1 PREDICTED: uncharacterized protein LOC105442854 [Strongylocentrotus purpuratus]